MNDRLVGEHHMLHARGHARNTPRRINSVYEIIVSGAFRFSQVTAPARGRQGWCVLGMVAVKQHALLD
jgi:hypothetical protein